MNDPSVLTNAELLHLCATVFEEHAPSIFVYARDGRRLIAELRKRATGTAPPTRQDVPGGGMRVVSDDGEVIVNVSQPRDRAHDDGKWLPNPRPGMANIRLSVVDEEGHVADMEFGNATAALAERVCKFVMAAHADDIKGTPHVEGDTSGIPPDRLRGALIQAISDMPPDASSGQIADAVLVRFDLTVKQ